MQVLAFVSQKGGAGKSTLAASIAALAARQGISTAVIDLDPQASISAWHTVRDSEDIELVQCHPPQLAATVAKLKKAKCQLVIIDTAPHNSSAAANAIEVADFTVIPVRPSAFDLAAAQETFNLLRHKQSKGGAVLNAAPPGKTAEQQAVDFIEAMGVSVLGKVGHRVAFQHAVSAGMGPTEYDSGSQAAAEVIDLWNTLQGAL
jgi:chromosome partitioning protein